MSATTGAQAEARLPQGTIRYRDSGSGEPIVFVHGLLVNGALWRKVTPLLEREFRCVVPDLPLGSHAVPMQAGPAMHAVRAMASSSLLAGWRIAGSDL